MRSSDMRQFSCRFCQNEGRRCGKVYPICRSWSEGCMDRSLQWIHQRRYIRGGGRTVADGFERTPIDGKNDFATHSKNGRVKTGIAGLDDALAGGLPQHRVYVIEGDPGAGKTTFALQFLREGVGLGERVLYVTLSETAEELHEVAASHGWSLDGID